MSFERILNEVEKVATENIKREEGDYTQNGLLYCGKCKTPKQARIVFLGKERTPPCLCKCQTEKRDREEEERKREQRIYAERERLSYLRSHNKLIIRVNELCKMICPEARQELERICFPEISLRQWNFDNDDGGNPRIIGAMKKYVEVFPQMQEDGKGLLLFGDVGIGKSYAAISVANALFEKGHSVFVTSFKDIANTVFNIPEKQQYYDNLNCFDLLVIDDLGVERKTEYMQEIVYNVIDSRYKSGKPMIITTNLTGDEIKHPKEIMNKRIYDRVIERCHPIEVTGINRRHQKVIESANEFNNLLGL